ncbi:hypothetical protein TNCV_1951451 [Trichonephila clavipes]|nr:hypothetical protein TNCV_1951451 [Trichonephila clavipes]
MFTDGAHKILASLSLRGNHTPKFHTALTGGAHRIDRSCRETLKENLQASAEKLGIEEDYQFYQENDSKHSAQNARLFGYHTNAPKFRPQPN